MKPDNIFGVMGPGFLNQVPALAGLDKPRGEAKGCLLGPISMESAALYSLPRGFRVSDAAPEKPTSYSSYSYRAAINVRLPRC